MNHLARGGTKLDGLNPLVFRQIERDAEVTVNVGAFGRHGEGFVHFHDEVGRAKLPAGSEFRRGGCSGAIAFGHAELDPGLDGVEIGITEAARVFVRVGRGFGLPGRHDARGGNGGDQLAVLDDIGVVQQGEGRSLTFAMAS